MKRSILWRVISAVILIALMMRVAVYLVGFSSGQQKLYSFTQISHTNPFAVSFVVSDKGIPAYLTAFAFFGLERYRTTTIDESYKSSHVYTYYDWYLRPIFTLTSNGNGILILKDLSTGKTMCYAQERLDGSFPSL